MRLVVGIFYLRVVNQKISINFSPFKGGNGTSSVEKSLGGTKRRYIEGVASGVDIDGHGERMTDNAINSFMRQANSGDLLLYADVHGIKSSEDIGILDKAEILPNRDWFVSFRLYDSSDGIASRNLEIADMIWKQVNGLPPYSTPREKGFSVEGTIPDGKIKEVTTDGKRVIDDIELDGVVIVPKPAYQASIAQAVMKAIDHEPSPFLARLSNINPASSNVTKRLHIQGAFEETLLEVTKSGDPNKISRLFEDYKTQLTQALPNPYDHTVTRKSIMMALKSQQGLLSGIWEKRVRKGSMLSPDESALLQNVKSLLDQLGQLDAGAQSVSGQQPGASPNQAMMSEDPLKDPNNMETVMKEEEYMEEDQDMIEDPAMEDDMMEEDDEVMKADNEGSAVEGEDDAEEKAVGATTELTEENVKVLKSVLDNLAKKSRSRTVAKSKPIANSSIVALSDAILEMTKVVKSINERQKATEKAVGYVLEGMGVAKSIKSQPVLVAPSNSGSLQSVGNSVQKSANRAEAPKSADEKRAEVKKSLREAIPSLFGNRY